MTTVFFGEAEIEDVRRRMAAHGWARRGLERIRSGLEGQREDLLAGTGGGALGTTFLGLALCARLLDGWHREAAEILLRNNDDPKPFLFKQTHDLCLGLDFLDGLDEQLRERVNERLLLPIAKGYMDAQRGGSNIQSTTNLSLLCIGIITEHPEFVERAVSDPERGHIYQLANSVYPDGFWYEQAYGSYHSGSIERFLRVQWIANRHGLPLDGDETIRKMLETLPGMALPGGMLPLIGDVGGDPGARLGGNVTVLEIAYAMYQIPWVAWALSRTERGSLWSLLVGRKLGAAEVPTPESRLFRSSGLCVLKSGEGEGYWDGKGSGASIAFGPHGDWHGHAGKLGIEYRRDARYLARDHGHSGGYSRPIHRMWFMTTLAHSTVVLDGRNQAFTWSHDRPELEQQESGVCQAHLFRQEVSACTVSADFAYPGCRLRRTLFLTPTYLLDIMECAALDGAKHNFDWVLHTQGIVQSDMAFAPAALDRPRDCPPVHQPPDKPYSCGTSAPCSYDYIREVEAAPTADRWDVDVMDCRWAADIWKITGKAMRLSMLGEAGTTVFKGVCPTAGKNVYEPVIVVRRRAKRTVFAALHVPGERKLDLECPINENGAIVCRVSGEDTGPDILVKQNEAKSIEFDGTVFEGQLDFRN